MFRVFKGNTHKALLNPVLSSVHSQNVQYDPQALISFNRISVYVCVFVCVCLMTLKYLLFAEKS